MFSNKKPVSLRRNCKSKSTSKINLLVDNILQENSKKGKCILEKQKENIPYLLNYQMNQNKNTSSNTQIHNHFNDQFITPKKIKKVDQLDSNITKKSQCSELKTKLLKKPIIISSAMKNIRINRAKLIDWFFQICFNCNLSWSTLWSSITMLDYLINDHKMVEVNTIHLTGTVCLFMSSKIHDHKHLTMQDLIKCVLHDKFTKEMILNQQRIILLKLANSSNSLPVLTIFQLFKEHFENGTKEEITFGLMQLAIIWMDLSRFENEKSLLDIFEELVICIKGGKLYPGVKQIYNFFHICYNCNQIQVYYKLIKW